MRILFVTSECARVYKLGGLGDVSRSLPLALSRKGVAISVAMPFYRDARVGKATCVGQITVDFAGRRELVFLFASTIPDSQVPLFLFRHPLLNSYNGGNMPARFAFFDMAVARLYLYSTKGLGGPYDVVHCNDWHTSLIPLMLGDASKDAPSHGQTVESRRVKTIVTIHNLLYQGESGIDVVKNLGLPLSLFHATHTAGGKKIRFLHEGLAYADVISTVSPTYAREIMRGSHGDGIREIIKRRGDRIVGILNGIDEDSWDPQRDSHLPFRYSEKSVFVKKPLVKRALQKVCKFPLRPVPVFGFVGRLERRQKGLDLIANALRLLPANTFQLILLGTGPKPMITMFRHLRQKYKNVFFDHEFNEPLARLIYAGSDIMLVPSKFEPCGLTQMIAMRYGTIPLVRKTGGLADSVHEGKTGFVFGPYTRTALAKKMEEAIRFYHEKTDAWHAMVRTVMRQDFSWKKRTEDYIGLYKKLLR